MERAKQIENECDREKHFETCGELLPRICETEEAKFLKRIDEDNKRNFERARHNWFMNYLRKPQLDKEIPPETSEPMLYCSVHNPPCNLECLYGKKKLDDDEGADVVKERIVTNKGAVYDTVAYRLPEDFGWEPIELSEEQKMAKMLADQRKEYGEDLEEKKQKKRKKPELMEFTGPVKITVLEKETFCSCYSVKRIHAGFIQLGYILMGSTVMCIYFYCLQFKHHYSTNIHIITSTVAFQFCLPTALLVRNKVAIEGYVLSNSHSFRNAILLKTFGLYITFIGVGLMRYWKIDFPFPVFTPHCLAGAAAYALAVAEHVLSILASKFLCHDRGHVVDCYLHLLSVLALISSFYAFVTGILLHESLKIFTNYQYWYYWVMAFALIFLLTAIFRPCMDCLFHIWGYIYIVAKYLYMCIRPHEPCTVRIKDIENPFNLMNEQKGKKN